MSIAAAATNGDDDHDGDDTVIVMMPWRPGWYDEDSFSQLESGLKITKTTVCAHKCT